MRSEARARARERHYISASIRRVFIKMTSRCGLGAEGSRWLLLAKIGRGWWERAVIKQKKGRRGRSGRGRIKILQRQLTIAKSRPLRVPSPPRISCATVDGPALPTLPIVSDKTTPCPLHFPPPVRKRAIINIEKMKNY